MKVKNIVGLIALVAACISYYVGSGKGLDGMFEDVSSLVGQRIGGEDKPDDGLYVDSEVGLPVVIHSESHKLIHRMGYSVLYDEGTHLPVWVAWTLTPDRLADVVSRYDKFLPDPTLEDPVTTDNYKKSGYDRGHMCPAADNKWSEQAMRESFYLTNICPQNHNLNSGDWRELEDACRDWACQTGKLYIVSGPVLYDGAHQTIGSHEIVVPDAFYKVVLSLTPLKGIGFIYKNASGNRPLDAYANTIDRIEEITGIDFFSALPDSIEDEAESQCNPEEWGLGTAAKKAG